MSQENVELVRSGADALARGDLDVARRFIDPAFEFDVTRTDLNPNVYHASRDWSFPASANSPAS